MKKVSIREGQIYYADTGNKDVLLHIENNKYQNKNPIINPKNIVAMEI